MENIDKVQNDSQSLTNNAENLEKESENIGKSLVIDFETNNDGSGKKRVKRIFSKDLITAISLWVLSLLCFIVLFWLLYNNFYDPHNFFNKVNFWVADIIIIAAFLFLHISTRNMFVNHAYLRWTTLLVLLFYIIIFIVWDIGYLYISLSKGFQSETAFQGEKLYQIYKNVKIVLPIFIGIVSVWMFIIYPILCSILVRKNALIAKTKRQKNEKLKSK